MKQKLLLTLSTRHCLVLGLTGSAPLSDPFAPFGCSNKKDVPMDLDCSSFKRARAFACVHACVCVMQKGSCAHGLFTLCLEVLWC